MYYFFQHTTEGQLVPTLPIRKTKPNPLHADSWRGMVHMALWCIFLWFKGGEYWLYELLKDGKTVSRAEVCTRHWQLPFLPIRRGGAD